METIMFPISPTEPETLALSTNKADYDQFKARETKILPVQSYEVRCTAPRLGCSTITRK